MTYLVNRSTQISKTAHARSGHCGLKSDTMVNSSATPINI